MSQYLVNALCAEVVGLGSLDPSTARDSFRMVKVILVEPINNGKSAYGE